MNKNIVLVAAVVATLTTTACGTTAKEDAEMNKQVQAEKPVESPEAMVDRAAQAFSNIEGLAPEKKTKLSEIYTRTFTESMSIRKEIGQSKSLLFKTLAKTDYKNSEVKTLKKKIVNLDQKRLNLMFKALEDVQTVVGKGADAEKIYEQLQDYETFNRMAKQQTM